MHPIRSPFIVCGLLLAGALVTGCSDNDNSTSAPPDGNTPAVVTDFTLDDVNPTSDTFGQGVSPRDHLARVSAWYFGHST